MNILLVEDNLTIVEALTYAFQNETYVFAATTSLKAMETYLEKNNVDVLILDINLPDGNGLEYYRTDIAAKHIPTIFLTAIDDEESIVTGIDLGADDYIVKPFDTKEVVARVKAVLRRTATEEEEGEAVYDKLVVNIDRYELRVDGKVIDTPPKELELLYHLAKNPNRVYTRDQLLDEVWGFEYFGDSRTIDVHVKRLREKLEGVSDQWSLKTVWGVGYKFEVK